MRGSRDARRINVPRAACRAPSAGTPLWLLVHVAPIRNERELVVLFLLTFRDITALKQPIDADDPKGGEYPRACACVCLCDARRSLTRGVCAGLSKFAKLARSVTRSRSVLVSALPALKEPARTSQLAHVSTASLHHHAACAHIASSPSTASSPSIAFPSPSIAFSSPRIFICALHCKTHKPTVLRSCLRLSSKRSFLLYIY